MRHKMSLLNKTISRHKYLYFKLSVVTHREKTFTHTSSVIHRLKCMVANYCKINYLQPVYDLR